MPSDLTLRPQSKAPPPPVNREDRIMKAHRKATDLSTYSNAYANFYEANPPEIHQLTMAQKMAAKEYFTNPKFRAKKNNTEIKNFVASVAGLPADTAEAFWMLMQHAPKGVSDKPLPDFSPAIEAGTSRRLAQSIGGDPETVGFLLSQFVAPDPFGPVTSALAVGRVAGQRLNKIQDLATAEKMGLRETEFDIEIARETGWFKGMDGEVKLLLDDSEAVVKDIKDFVLNDPTIIRGREAIPDVAIVGTKNLRLEELLEFPELYEAYPMLKDLPINISYKYNTDGTVEVYKKGFGIGMLADTKQGDLKGIHIFNVEPEYPFRETLMHEIEHVIQTIEGFARGGEARPMVETVETMSDAYELRSALKLVDEGAETPDLLYDRMLQNGFDSNTATLMTANRKVNEYMGASNSADTVTMDLIRADNDVMLDASADKLDFILTYLDSNNKERAIEELRDTLRNHGGALRHMFYRAYRNLKGEAEANFAGKTTGMQLEQLLDESRLDARQYGYHPVLRPKAGFGEQSSRTIPGQAQVVKE